MIFLRVLYEPTEQRRFVTDMLDVFRQALLSARRDQEKLEEILPPLALYLGTIRSALKSATYESEQEYRLLNMLPVILEEPHPRLHFRVGGGSVVPYLIANLSQSKHGDVEEPIGGIRVGPCLDATLMESSLRLLASQYGRNLPVSTSDVSMRCE
jgi:hypothetical protein